MQMTSAQLLWSLENILDLKCNCDNVTQNKMPSPGLPVAGLCIFFFFKGCLQRFSFTLHRFLSAK